MLDGLRVVLHKPRFPENIGMVARACANMGCSAITLIAPEREFFAKALPLATPKGKALLESIEIAPSLEEAIHDCHFVYGTTARLGGWRRSSISPNSAAQKIVEHITQGAKIAMVFGPEDRGLTNEEISLCHELVTIPTAEASSLNLAQAVLLLLYECLVQKKKQNKTTPPPQGVPITNAELLLFLDQFKQILLKLDCLHGNNIDYFFLPWQHIFCRVQLKRHEFDALMGFCRQLQNALNKH